MKRFLWTLGSSLFLLLYLGDARFGAGQTIPAGSKVDVRLSSQLDTESARPGQPFTGTLAQPLVVGGRTVMARGSKVEGVVVEAVSSGRLKKPASITLRLTSPASEPLRIDGKSHFVRNAELIGGGAAAGALIGSLAGGKKGALIGAGAGAGAGTTAAYLTGKKEIVLPAEMALAFTTGGGAAAAPRATAPTEARAEREPRGRENEQGENEERGRGGREARGGAQALMFSSPDQQLIRRYFAAQTSNLPPGLAKRGGNLPPGLERQLEKNGTLPPGLQRRMQPFPADLSEQLPPLPTGYQRVVIGVKAVILDRANKILDVMVIR